jgi:hypothetical protein
MALLFCLKRQRIRTSETQRGQRTSSAGIGLVADLVDPVPWAVVEVRGMPTFSASSLEVFFGKLKASNLTDWCDELAAKAPVVWECVSNDTISLAAMKPFLARIHDLYPRVDAFACIAGAIEALRTSESAGPGDPDSICQLGPEVNPDELRDEKYVHMRKRQLPDHVIAKASEDLGDTYVRHVDVTVRPFDWCRFCKLLATRPLGNWRGFVWLAPLEDILSEVTSGTPYSATPMYWFYRHWLLVGLPWDFVPPGPLDTMLAALAGETLFVILHIEGKAIRSARVPTVLDVRPGPLAHEYFFRPQGWWMSKGITRGTYGLTLDLSGNPSGAIAKPGAREAVALVRNIRSVQELIPEANGGFSLLRETAVA